MKTTWALKTNNTVKQLNVISFPPIYSRTTCIFFHLLQFFWLVAIHLLARLSPEMPIKLAYYRHPVARLARPMDYTL